MPPKEKPQESLYASVDTRFMMETLSGQHIEATLLLNSGTKNCFLYIHTLITL